MGGRVYSSAHCHAPCHASYVRYGFGCSLTVRHLLVPGKLHFKFILNQVILRLFFFFCCGVDLIWYMPPPPGPPGRAVLRPDETAAHLR